ncbi:MAG TPA: RNA 2',3'-cyclic phosphodiesterase [Candidatus Acidoferrales bacterium]|nr:RNA 2',3'-cyclic phosphodiesterase [Candidatus Acidoferrales bacterium]
MTVRLFVALDLPEEVRRRIAEFSRTLRPLEPDARWLRTASIHLTLKFIGERPPEQVEGIRRALASVRAAPGELRFRGAGFFPDDGRPRVFWVGIEANPALAELADGIERALEPLGIRRESRPFVPHLTLARLDGEKRAGALRRAVAERGAEEFGVSVERAFHLYQSQLGPSGAQYTKLETFLFALEAP